MKTLPHTGWYLVAFLDELAEEITALAVGSHALIAVRSGAEVRIFDGTCPHRGAHLGHGGRLVRDCVVCPFHGKAVHLGEREEPRLGVREHRCLVAGSCVFARLGRDDDDDRGFTDALTGILTDRELAAGSTYRVAVPPELVVENAFDVDHFVAVHETRRADMTIAPSVAGELAGDGVLSYRPRPGMDLTDAAQRSGFFARAYSPTLVASEIGRPESSHVVLTGTVPTPDGGCVARVAYAVRRGPGGAPPNAALVAALVSGGHDAFAEDQVVWEHLDLDAPARFDARDEPVRAFRRFCAGFGTVSDAHSDKLRSASDAHSDKLRSASDAHSDKLRSVTRHGVA